MSEKCVKCGKTVYAMERITAAKAVYHKACLRCSVCNWKLEHSTLREMDGEIYCKTHHPVGGSSGPAKTKGGGSEDSSGQQFAAAAASPRLDTVNEQIRNVPAPSQSADRQDIQEALSRPKQDLAPGVQLAERKTAGK